MPFRLPWRAESALFDMLPRVKKCPFLAILPCPFLGLGETLFGLIRMNMVINDQEQVLSEQTDCKEFLRVGY